MRKLLTILLLGIAIAVSGQIYNEKDAMDKNHINLKTHHIYFVIHGMIEIDGHTFKNQKSDCPIMFYASLSGVTLKDTCNNIQYVNAGCSKKGCSVLHLKPKETITLQPSFGWPNGIYLNDSDIITIPN